MSSSKTIVAAEATAQQTTPQELVASLSARLFALLDRDRGAARRDPELIVQILDQLLSPHFDAEYMARLVLGAEWRIATPEDRQRFAAALYHSLLRTYARAVGDWTSDRFKLLPFSGDPAALQVIVRTYVTPAVGAVVAVDYRLHVTAEGWKVFDVIVDGVSYTRNYHDDISAEVSQKGLEAVITRLEKPGSRTSAPARQTP